MSSVSTHPSFKQPSSTPSTASLNRCDDVGGPACFALLDDCTASEEQPRSRLYTGLRELLQCDDPQQLDVFWPSVERAQRAGLHAVLLADYEWGARLLQAGHEGLRSAETGGLRVLLFAQLEYLSAPAVDRWLAAREAGVTGAAAGATGVGDPAVAGVRAVQAGLDEAGFAQAIARIHRAIADGETYQVNFTFPLDFEVFGHPLSLYRRLRAYQPVPFGAFIALPEALGGGHVLSCSPELFLRNDGGVLTARPMKGTAARAQPADATQDARIAQALAQDSKNRAENLMIVDLLRNDLGRVARTGSVSVPALFSVETYATVFQMTSTVQATLPPATPFPELLRALFPCGSITGAPKHRTMQLIAQLEPAARGLYTGSMGWIDAPMPGQACGDFCLSVAIRTLELRPAGQGRQRDAPPQACQSPVGHRGRMGVGAGIVIDSEASAEYRECLLKARFLTGLEPGFSLFETLYATRETGVRHLDRHLARLQGSAAELHFMFPRARIEQALRAQCAQCPPQVAMRLKLVLHKRGDFELQAAPLDPLPAGPVRLLLAEQPVEDACGLLRYKTTLRSAYDRAVVHAQACGAFDMLFVDREGYLTEGARSNLFVQLEGQWFTPPLSGAVLPGTMRAVLLEDAHWAAQEHRLRPSDLLRAQRIVVTNALRGALDAYLQQEEASLTGSGAGDKNGVGAGADPGGETGRG